MDHPIYLDNQATTPLDPRVLDAMLPYLTTEYGNPSSPHAYGHAAAAAIAQARQTVADLLGAAHENKIVFTSGATEANHLALLGTAHALRDRGDHIITTAVEHKSVLAACDRLADAGLRITRLPVDSDGLVDPDALKAAITPRTILISVMHANNEIGVVQPLARLADVAQEHGILLHTDAAQSLGGVSFDLQELRVDLLSFSAHKIYGPKGVGALYIKRGSVRPVPQMVGGGQENGQRAGTPNVPGIVGLGAAARILHSERLGDIAHLTALRDALLADLALRLPDMRLNGPRDRHLPGNLNITIPGTDADELLADLPELALSTGSACNTGNPAPSHVLTAIGLTPTQARATLRISLGRFTTPSEVEYAARRLADATTRWRTHD